MGLAAGAAGAAVVAFVGSALSAASDLQESTNKTKVVFGDSSDAVLKFGETAADSLGISNAAAIEAASCFGAMFDSAGLAESEASKMSTTMVTLAADMASFNNTDPSEMLEKLRSGLAGEAEPLRKFGVFLSEAAVQAQAVKMGVAEAGESSPTARSSWLGTGSSWSRPASNRATSPVPADSLANSATHASMLNGRTPRPAFGEAFLPAAQQSLEPTDPGARRRRTRRFLGATSVFGRSGQEAARSGRVRGRVHARRLTVRHSTEGLIAFSGTAADAIKFVEGPYRRDRGLVTSVARSYRSRSRRPPTATYEATEADLQALQGIQGDRRESGRPRSRRWSARPPPSRKRFTLSPAELNKIAESWATIARTIAQDLRAIGKSDLEPAMRERRSLPLPPEMRHAWVEGNASQRKRDRDAASGRPCRSGH